MRGSQRCPAIEQLFTAADLGVTEAWAEAGAKRGEEADNGAVLRVEHELCHPYLRPEGQRHGPSDQAPTEAPAPVRRVDGHCHLYPARYPAGVGLGEAEKRTVRTTHGPNEDADSGV